MTNKDTNVLGNIQNVLEELFTEFLSSPEFKEVAKPHVHDYVMSDLNQKVLRNFANREEPLTQEELALVAHIMDRDNEPTDAGDNGDAEWTDDMVKEYADNLRNFLYQYKQSATQVDPSINPDEYHRGPMAQDIEKVAPDCVKETSQGVKVVDGNRLALVNAGVIGDLARRLIELEDSVYGNNVK